METKEPIAECSVCGEEFEMGDLYLLEDGTLVCDLDHPQQYEDLEEDKEWKENNEDDCF